MKSPVHPAILGWLLRPRPTGHRRIVAGYLSVAAAGAVATITVLGFDHAADTCTIDGFGCLGLLFRGLATGVVLGLVVLTGCSIGTKLGGLYVLAVVGFSVTALTIGILFGRTGAPALPITAVLLAAVPALAAWSTRPRPEQTIADTGAVRRRRTGPAAARARPLQPLAR